MQIQRLYISSGHNYFGHHGQKPGEHPMFERDEIECVAGRGIAGDRFFEFKPDYSGQITFFAEEVYDALCREFALSDKDASGFRRNVITRGADLNSLIGREFEIENVRFRGEKACDPCHWMDYAFAPGAEAFLKGQGGLRASILSSGKLHRQRV